MKYGWRDFWRFRALEFTVALVIVTSSAYLVDKVQNRLRADIPAANWFVVNQLYVPDFKIGEDPNITYDRQIKEPFLGFWVVEVERQIEGGRFMLECSGSGVSDYQVSDYIPDNAVTLEWFVGKKCAELVEGPHRIRASWRMKRDDWPEKSVVAYSNIFEVTK